jgi:phosphate/sulfate permease
MGSEICRMTPSRGFCVEWMAAVTVLACGISKEFAIPVSTTHCQVYLLTGHFKNLLDIKGKIQGTGSFGDFH